MDINSFICIGNITKVHGFKGEVVFYCNNLKIDFNKIKIDNFKRVDVIPCKDQYLDNCDKYFTFTFKISEIVINKSKAYVELNFQCGAKCGKGIKYELKKENGTWKIDKENLIWIS